MAKRGLAVLRSALFMPALVSKGHNPVVMAMAERLSTKGMAPKAIVGAAMHKLARLIYGVLKSGKPFDANWAHKQGTPGAVQMMSAATVA
jgi:transposase